MPPSARRRRTCTKVQAAPANGATLEPAAALILDDTSKLQASFELDDFNEWWTTSSGDPSMDDSIHPLMRLPDESQTTLAGICADDPQNANGNVGNADGDCPLPTKSSRKKPSLNAPSRNPALGIAKSISPRESHILSERQRRQGMNHLFATLAELLPETATKSDKSTIVSEIISYIQALQGDLEMLSKKRKNKLPVMPELNSPCSQQSNSTTTSFNDVPAKEQAMKASLAPNVILSICGDDAFVTMSASKGRNLLSRALTVLHQHNLKVVDGSVSSNDSLSFHYFHVKVPQGQLVCKDGLQRALQSLASSAPDRVAS